MEHLAKLETFLVVRTEVEVILASSGEIPGMLVNTPQGTGQPPTENNPTQRSTVPRLRSPAREPNRSDQDIGGSQNLSNEWLNKS